MASKSDSFENELLAYIFNSVAIPTLGTDLWVALHTANPDEGGSQTTSEATYTNYQRVNLTRANSTQWTVAGSQVNPANQIDFPTAGAGPSNTITHFSIGKAGPTGASQTLYYGPVTPNIAVSEGVTPSLTEATQVTED